MSANASDSAALLVLVAAGFVAMAWLRAMHTDATPSLVELHGMEPAKLSPFLDAAGNPVSIDSFRRKVVILNLGAPWCVPCLQEPPSLDRSFHCAGQQRIDRTL
jgi:thiol-disulfide isomerase/thioredoxin